MQDIQQQIQELTAQVEALQVEIEELKSGDATFSNVVCNQLQVLDDEGMPRFIAKVDEGGVPEMECVDNDGNVRLRFKVSKMRSGISPTEITWIDKSGQVRLSLSTSRDGDPYVAFYDKNGKQRIAATTCSSYTSLRMGDKNGKPIICAEVERDGTVKLPNAKFEL